MGTSNIFPIRINQFLRRPSERILSISGELWQYYKAPEALFDCRCLCVTLSGHLSALVGVTLTHTPSPRPQEMGLTDFTPVLRSIPGSSTPSGT